MSNQLVSSIKWQKLLSELAAQRVQVQVEEVCAYLDEYPDIGDVVPAISRSVRQEFGPDAPLSLSVNRDPEIDDKYLVLRVTLPGYSPDIMPRIHAVSDAHEDQRWDKKGHILVEPHFPPHR